MNNIKVVAFDCDGVMFDTTNANMAYYNHILDHFGRPAMTAEQFAFCHMHPVDESMAHLFEDEKDFRAAQTYRKQMSYVPFLKQMNIEPYLKTLLNRIRPRYKTAVATNRSDTMDRVLSEPQNIPGSSNQDFGTFQAEVVSIDLCGRFGT
jgi:beta-phosphoglucomutase-like phosphatase (HAD superfamily)